MIRFIFLIPLLLAVSACKKEYSNDDVTLYTWKRELYRARVHPDGPATFSNSDPKVVRNTDAVFMREDIIILTEYKKDRQQDSIFNASGRTMAYKYKKLDRVDR
ncbi:hypothetical protein [Pedobacter faecalis]|uniref:hypothetical protein n=1 Tax=Pedobacter faecalis TaxID=3041495 RepID=UPI00254C8493|nr:hypothetical protein [Pedobacter sp. ELA7]